MVKGSTGEKPKKKRGRPKGSKNKSKTKTPKVSAPKEEPKVEAVEPKTISQAIAASEAAWTAAEQAAAAAEAAEARSAAARSAAEELEKKEYEAAAAEAAAEAADEPFTNKRKLDRIFRREMGEPEFFQAKKDLVPLRPILTKDEEEEISRKVQIPTNQIPLYKPEHVLSPEFGGTSNYEVGIQTQREETIQKLRRLRSDPNANPQEIKLAEEDLKTLDYLYENFNIGMNVFRTAKGGRSKLRE